MTRPGEETRGRPLTLLEKIYASHDAATIGDGIMLLYVDIHLLTDVTSPQAFEGLRTRGIGVHAPGQTLAVADHNVPTTRGEDAVDEPESRMLVEALEANCRDFGVPFVPVFGRDHGIVHVIGPELGLTLPGTTIVCGDSHTATHGAFGALAFGIGTSEIEHVLATQTLVHVPVPAMLVRVDGRLPFGTTAKDLVLSLIAAIGTDGATGHIIEFAGPAIEALDMAGRMTICNMVIEAGARAGLIAPDETSIEWLRGRRQAPAGAGFDEAAGAWRALRSDPGASYARTVVFDAAAVVPMVTWGTSPETAVPITDCVPRSATGAVDRQMLDYMALEPGTPMRDVRIDAAFIGSCTNSRLEDLRAAAAVARGRRVAPGVRALVVPGSELTRRQAEEEGLDRVFLDAGFEWRGSGCSMCLGMNPDRLAPGERCASSSNRNFEGRQGPGGRTHLMSPAMVAAAAIAGHLVDVRAL